MRLSLATFILCCWYLSVTAQQHIIDSLEHHLPTTTEDSARILLLGDLAYYCTQTDPTKGLQYARETLALAMAVGDQAGIANGYYKITYAQLTLGNYEEAIAANHAAIRSCEERQDTVRLLFALDLMGVVYSQKAAYSEALPYLFRSVEMAVASGNRERAGATYNNIGEVYLNSHDTINARKYFLQALPLLQEENNPFMLIIIHHNLALVATDHEEKKKHLDRAVELSLEQGYQRGLAYNYGPLAEYWENRDSVELALSYYQKAVTEARAIGEVYVLMGNLIRLGSLQHRLGRVAEAKSNLTEALDLGEGPKATNQTKRAAEVLAQIYQEEGNYALAYTHLEKAYALADSIYGRDLTDALAEADARYQNSTQRSQLMEQELEIERQRNRTGQLIILFVLVLAAAITGYQVYLIRQRKKQHAAEMQLTKEREKLNALEELDQLKTNFFTNIAHELRTPLTLIKGPLEDLVPKAKGTSLAKGVERAHANSKRLLTLVNEIMDLSKIEAKRLEIQKSTIEVDDILKRIFHSFQSLAEQQDVALNYHSEIDPSIRIETDPSKLEKIINNLVSNALKHTNVGDQVSMRSDLSAGTLTVIVQDSGAGIHPDDVPHIFDRYYQSTRGASKLSGGTGIGLALAREYARLLGGDIVVQSTLEAGSSFVVTLQVGLVRSPASQPKAADVFVPLPAVTEDAGPRASVLIVEDHGEMRDYLLSILSVDHDCSVARDGAEALQLLQKQTFDLVLSDVMMPLMSGFELREKISNIDRLHSVPFIFLTARSLPEDIEMGLNLGVDDYITKPFETAELKARVRNSIMNNANRRSTPPSDQRVAPPVDKQLVRDAFRIVQENLSRADFKVSELSRQLGYGERQLRRVLRERTGLSPVEFVLEARLLKARGLLEQKAFHTIAEVQHEVGIHSASYFTKAFAKRFGKRPTEMLQI